MSERVSLFMIGEAFAVGAALPVGGLYALTNAPLAEPVASLGDLVVLGWLAAIVVGTAVIAERRRLSSGALLGGGVMGVGAGFVAFDALVGWSFVLFATVPLAVVGLTAGAWISYERTRRLGDVHEPPYGTWRAVFAVTMVLPAAFLALLV